MGVGEEVGVEDFAGVVLFLDVDGEFGVVAEGGLGFLELLLGLLVEAEGFGEEDEGDGFVGEGFDHLDQGLVVGDGPALGGD